jgi:hypothetical protein
MPVSLNGYVHGLYNFSVMSNSKQKEIFVLILCFLLGFALRFYTFDQKSLWIDEIHTLNDSRDDLRGQLNFYEKNPTYLHPPLFFVLTHLFYPFTKPERDLRIIPLIFGTLSIPMIYSLSRLFSPIITIPCSLSLTFMAYHISLSQDGRSYSLLMFIGLTGLYFFMRHLQTSKKRDLALVAFFFSLLFYTSYSSIPFIAVSQILWFYRTNEEVKKPNLSSFLILNGLILLFCLPWILFMLINYNGQPMMHSVHTENPGSFLKIMSDIIQSWVPLVPLRIVSVILLIVFPIISKSWRNALILLTVFILPIGGLYLFCKLLNITHFVTSRYFINFLPLFFITLFLSLDALEVKFKKLKRFIRLRLLFVIFLIASNIVILPLYYRSEKQDFRGLAIYLKGHLRNGDKIFDLEKMGTLGILHYFGVNPEGRHFTLDFWKRTENEFEYRKSFIYRNSKFTIYHSKNCCIQYVADGSRLWIITSKWGAKKIKDDLPCVLKGYFDGSFYNLNKFPTDASMYLFLWDLASPEEKGIDMPIE